MSQKSYFLVSGMVFLLIALVHLLRLVYQWQAQIGVWVVPMWMSVVAMLFMGCLSYQAFQLYKKHSSIMM